MPRETPEEQSHGAAGYRERHSRRSRSHKIHACHRRHDGWLFFLAASHPEDESDCSDPLARRRGCGATEFALHDSTLPLKEAGGKWRDEDFVRHYYCGNGRSVSLCETGHLQQIADHYSLSGIDNGPGILSDFADKVASEVRAQRPGDIQTGFRWHFLSGPDVFSSGRHTVYRPVSIEGQVAGVLKDQGEMLSFRGKAAFTFRDDFADPADRGFEPGGTPYAIEGRWTTRFSAEIFKDRERSAFGAALPA